MKQRVILALVLAASVVPTLSFAGSHSSQQKTGEKRTVATIPMHGVTCVGQEKGSVQDASSRRTQPASSVSGRVIRGL